MTRDGYYTRSFDKTMIHTASGFMMAELLDMDELESRKEYAKIVTP